MLLKQSGGISIDLQRPIEEDGLDARQFVTTPKYIGSIRIAAGNLRAEELLVGYSPVDRDDPADPENPYHGLVWRKVTSTAFKRIMRSATWFVEIEGVSLI